MEDFPDKEQRTILLRHKGHYPITLRAETRAKKMAWLARLTKASVTERPATSPDVVSACVS